MKFAREFQDCLEKGEYPHPWLKSAISYKKLKKCIKKVQAELEGLGLDRTTLEALWLQNSSSTSSGTLGGQGTQTRHVRYFADGGKDTTFTPKLTIALDPEDGSPIDAWLSHETRRVLRELIQSQQASRRASVASLETVDGTKLPGGYSGPSDPEAFTTELSEQLGAVVLEEPLETVEIPLTQDSEFFALLQRELLQLDQLQETEQESLKLEIFQLGHDLSTLKNSKSRRSKANLEAWREIFRRYIEAQIFFSSHEQDAGIRDPIHAQTHLQLFTKDLAAHNRKELKLDQEAGAALDRFVQINIQLLKFIKFQEINLRALSKILKKFDKRTALQSQLIKTAWLNTAPFMAQDVAKATSYTISKELLQIIPQPDDYLCPVCFSISYKPVRLRCNHIFCIRCLIVMQRAEQDKCPLCREEVVMEASSYNLDEKMAKFLKANFPTEVKEKQRANEIAAGVDRFGEGFTGTHKCAVM